MTEWLTSLASTIHLPLTCVAVGLNPAHDNMTDILKAC